MQLRHVPRINRRYWSGILFVSIFGTNLGDFYAHESGLGLGPGLLLLMAFFAVTVFAETKDRVSHEVYYWAALIMIRTGATNIADYLAFRVRIPAIPLAFGLAAIMALLAWRAAAARPPVIVSSGNAAPDPGRPALATTNLIYWGAMLAAGVFGTVTGDICSRHFGQGRSSIVLGMMLLTLLATSGSRAATRIGIYWCAVALARTAGTCMGDWLAENKLLPLGLPLSTLLTGIAFIAILALWRSTTERGSIVEDMVARQNPP